MKAYEQEGDVLDAETFDSVLVVMQRLHKSFVGHSLTACQVKFVKTRQIFRDLF